MINLSITPHNKMDSQTSPKQNLEMILFGKKASEATASSGHIQGFE